MRTKIILFLALAFIGGSLSAQPGSSFSWWNPAKTPGWMPGGIAWRHDSIDFYSRLPEDAAGSVRKDVFHLSRESAGVSVNFATDAPEVVVEYCVKEQLQFPHMPATGVSGIDLYDGLGQRIVGSYVFGDTVRYQFSGLSSDSPADGENYTLYLPLYNTISWLRIGVEKGHLVSPVNKVHPFSVVVYGTSIAQGACASRPGMAWGNLLGRLSGCEVINLGFSGNGRLEPEVIDCINRIAASIYILDCLPNLVDRPGEEVTQKIVNAVRQIRRMHPGIPIILTEHAGFGDEQRNAVNRQRCSAVNAALQKAMAELKERKIAGVYVLTKKNIGLDSDCFVDQVHPNDAGMVRYARAYWDLTRQILKR